MRDMGSKPITTSLNKIFYITSGIGGSAREVENLAPQIGDCFQSFRIGIKREEIESFSFERQ